MKAIAAMDLNRVIGVDGRIPWHCPDDFAWFKKMTTGGSLIMGRKTFDMVGILPGRFTYILTNNRAKQSLPPGGAGQYIDYQYIADGLQTTFPALRRVFSHHHFGRIRGRHFPSGARRHLSLFGNHPRNQTVLDCPVLEVIFRKPT